MLSGGLRIQSADGVELSRFASINGSDIARDAEQVSEGEWIFPDMPGGRLTLSLGAAGAMKSAVVDVNAAAGAEPAVADLR